MTLLTPTKEQEKNILSGEQNSFQFSVLWQKKSENEKVKEITKSSVDTIDQLFDFLRNKKNCKIINQEEIADFLKKNDNLIKYLLEAPFRISDEFGEEVGLNLELSFDPEYSDDEGELFLNIETKLDVKTAHNKLNEIDKEWLIPKVGKDITKFNLYLDFI